MITNSEHDELFAEPARSAWPKLLGALLALLLTTGLIIGYMALRKRHAETSAALVAAEKPTVEARQPPKALVLVDEALLQGGTTIIGGTVRNTSAEKLAGVSVELELKRRKDGIGEKRMVPLKPEDLDPQQEGRYSLQLKAQDYGSARLIALRVGPDSVPLPYTTGQGQKRPLERLDGKTIILERRPAKRDEFLNSPDSPARVP